MKNAQGFTLVELLVVIAILTILGTIGIIQYYGFNSKARDSARRADIYDIATALEVNKTIDGYIPLAQSQFSSFQWADPQGNAYCLGTGNPADPASTEPWGNSCPAGFSVVAPGVPSGNFLSWKVCSFLETSGTIFCKTSRQ